MQAFKTGPPAALDGDASPGVSLLPARSDHTHALNVSAIVAKLNVQTGVTPAQLAAESAARAAGDTAEGFARTAADDAEAAARAAADAALDARLAILEYVYPDISGLSNTVGIAEIGSTVDDVTLNWSLNKTMTGLDIASPGPGTITPTLLTYAMTGLGLTADQTFTVTADDGTNTDAATTSVLFQRKRYWGVDATSTPDASTINGLTSAEFATSRGQSRSMPASAEYLYFAWPSTFGTPSFTVNGLSVTGWVQTVVSFTNPSGHTENYDVWRSPFPLTGTFAVVVS